MKKLAFMVVLVAAIVGIVFGSISLASAARPPLPTTAPLRPIPTPNPCQQMLDEINALSTQVTALDQKVTDLTQGNITRMESFYGDSYNCTPGTPCSKQFLYPQIRHVSITMEWIGMHSGDSILVQLPATALLGWLWNTSGGAAVNDFRTIEFDANVWNLSIFSSTGDMEAAYFVTATYPGE